MGIIKKIGTVNATEGEERKSWSVTAAYTQGL